MALQAGQLLIVRQHLTLPEGVTPVDTKLTQVNRGLDPDPPLGGSPTVASRVQVIPLAPIPPWLNGQITHGEPYLNPTTDTVWVDFTIPEFSGEQTVNVEFWCPHTLICPISCDLYNPPSP